MPKKNSSLVIFINFGYIAKKKERNKNNYKKIRIVLIIQRL